jgi:hemerythrin superfamily protein
MPDAISVLKADHKRVEALFKRFEKAGDRAHKTRRDVVDQIVEELSVHAAVEEQVFYPAVREAVPEADDDVLEALEEHHVAKWTLSELDGMDPEHERFKAKVTVLIESVRHHIEEEESDLFPKVRQALGRKALTEIGDAMELARAVAPTRPHPRQPDEPPGNILAGTAAAGFDRARKAGMEAVEKGLQAVRSRRR